MNDDVIVVTESSDHDRVASMSRLQKVVHKIKHMHEKTYENVYIWSDGMGSQFRPRYIFKLLASKCTMDGMGGMIKNVILRKVKFGQLVVHSPLEFLSLSQNLFCQFTLYTCLKAKILSNPEDISMARKINQTLKIHKLEKTCSQNGDT